MFKANKLATLKKLRFLSCRFDIFVNIAIIVKLIKYHQLIECNFEILTYQNTMS